MALTSSHSAPRKIFDFPGNPPDPLPLIREGGRFCKEGLAPLLNTPENREPKRGKVPKYIMGSLRGGFAPSFFSFPLPYLREGDKGGRFPHKK